MTDGYSKILHIRSKAMNNYCVKQNYTIKEVIETIDESRNRNAIVLNDNDKVIGVISQGDIIRALCSGKNLYSNVEGIINNDFLYMNSLDMEQAYKLFRKLKITLLPVVDDDFKLQSVIVLDDIYKYLEER